MSTKVDIYHISFKERSNDAMMPSINGNLYPLMYDRFVRMKTNRQEMDRCMDINCDCIKIPTPFIPIPDICRDDLSIPTTLLNTINVMIDIYQQVFHIWIADKYAGIESISGRKQGIYRMTGYK